MQGRIKGESAGATYALGAVYGFAGFCSGPILGAVLTVAAASGQVLQGAGLLAVYAAGMAFPLLLMALLWNRFDLGHRRWLRGREISLGRFRFHTTSLISGFMFILIGVLFIVYEGTSALEGFYVANGATDLAFSAQEWANGLTQNIPAVAVISMLCVLFALFLYFGYSKGKHKKSSKR